MHSATYSSASKRLLWSVRLTSPGSLLAVTASVILAIWLIAPTAATLLRKRFPTNMTLRVPQVGAYRRPTLTGKEGWRASRTLLLQPTQPVPESASSIVPVTTPPAPRVTTPLQTQSAPSPTARPVILPCRVVSSGAVTGAPGEWLVQIELEGSAVSAHGSSVLTKGTRASGRVKLDRSGQLIAWPSVWRITIPEEEGSRDVDLNAAFEASTGGITPGSTGRWNVQGIARIGERQEALEGTALSQQSPVSILTNRPDTGPDADLPRP